MKDKKLEVREWIISIIIAGVIVFILKGFLFDIILVSGSSMEPTIHNNNRVAIEKLSLYNQNFKRGEIIIFNPEVDGEGLYIKRIIGLPGDDVEIKYGRVYINGSLPEENYLKPGTYTDMNMQITVPDGYVFVLGDNRENSKDSRIIGPVPIKNIKGHAILKIFPFNDTSRL